MRATAPSTPSVEATRVAAALDGQLDDAFGVEVDRIGGERRARRVLHALVNRQDRQIAGAAEPAVIVECLQCPQDCRAAVAVDQRTVDEVRTRQIKRFLGDAGAAM